MKIMILNTHSLAEPEYESKLVTLARSLVQTKLDTVALQEASQSRNALPAVSGWLRESGCVPCYAKDLDMVSPHVSQTVMRAGNHALNLALFLARAGVSYQWTWTSTKIGYGICDEGSAVLNRLPILGTSQFYIAGIRDYEN